MLSVLAGPDGVDPRQYGTPPAAGYVDALTGDVAGLRLAVVREGFDHEGLSEPDVDQSVRDAVRAFEMLGAVATEVSPPWHRDAMPVWNAVAVEGATAIMIAAEGIAHGAKGDYLTGLVDAFAESGRAHGDRLSETVKLAVLAGRWMAEAPEDPAGGGCLRAQRGPAAWAAEFRLTYYPVAQAGRRTSPLRPSNAPSRRRSSTACPHPRACWPKVTHPSGSLSSITSR